MTLVIKALRAPLLAGLFFWGGGSASAQNSAPVPKPKVKDAYITFGHKKLYNPRKVEALIVHSTHCASEADTFSVSCVLDQFRRYHVSAHYLIDRQGTIHRLVKEEALSYHAGPSRLPNGHTWVNIRTIGVELLIHKKGSPTPAQYQSLAWLVADVENRHKLDYVLGHKDIAPERKTDPWGFDWDYFYPLIGRRADGSPIDPTKPGK